MYSGSLEKHLASYQLPIYQRDNNFYLNIIAKAFETRFALNRRRGDPKVYFH